MLLRDNHDAAVVEDGASEPGAAATRLGSAVAAEESSVTRIAVGDIAVVACATASTKPAVATVFAEDSGKARGAATTTEPAAGTSAAAVLDAATTPAAVRAIATVGRDGRR